MAQQQQPKPTDTDEAVEVVPGVFSDEAEDRAIVADRSLAEDRAIVANRALPAELDAQEAAEDQDEEDEEARL